MKTSDNFWARVDPVTGHIWSNNFHLEVCKREVSEDAIDIIKSILEGNKVEKLVLNSQQLADIIDEHPDNTSYTLISDEGVGEWRWGIVREVIIKDNATNKLWGATYRVQIGDNYYNSLEDGGTVHLYPVEAVEVTIIEYKRIKQ